MLSHYCLVLFVLQNPPNILPLQLPNCAEINDASARPSLGRNRTYFDIIENVSRRPDDPPDVAAMSKSTVATPGHPTVPPTNPTVPISQFYR